MTRARAEALVLVNWRGVFYERYLLDRHVTALEGANGSGKTTVMIAAYIVLLPDMTRLRFTNLGETGATGGDRGIWGRLGQAGGPSYAAIDFALAGPRRVIAGVLLERKGEPSVEPTPWVVTGLDETVRLQDLMLVGSANIEAVPELAELRENAARLGGRLQVFGSAREYFAMLFELGVTPMRLNTDEERNKLNEMLRTSMTGGISRALTSELRGFLLKEESGLAATLQTMKNNLDACRRTRTQVQDSRRLEREIGGVYEAGQAMFAAALAATRERAVEFQRRVAEAEAARDEARERERQTAEALERATHSLGVIEARREQLDEELRTARSWETRVEAALTAAAEVAQRHATLDDETAAEQLASAARDRADTTYEEQRAELRRAYDNHKLAADGLADLQKGLDDLHRRASAHRQATRRLDDARTHLQAPELDADSCAGRLADTTQRLEALDRERVTAAQQVADATVHRSEHQAALEALCEIVKRPVAAESAYDEAIAALRAHHALRSLADQATALAQELADARRAAARQVATRERASELEIELAQGSASDHVRVQLDEAELARRDHEEAARVARAAAEEAERLLAETKAQLRELAERESTWRALRERARRIGEALEQEVGDRSQLDQARRTLSRTLDASRRREEELIRTRDLLHDEIRGLLHTGGPFEPDLMRLRDQLEGEMLAGRFEDIGVDEAAHIEARLGSLVHAIVVTDPDPTVPAVVNRPASLASVWLVRDTANLGAVTDHNGEIDVVVDDGPAVRVTRVPEHPSLGRKAREKRAEELRVEEEAREAELDAERASRRGLERLAEDLDALLEDLAVWLAGDPAPDITAAQQMIVELEGRVVAHRNTMAASVNAAAAIGPRIDGLRSLLADAHLLEPPDHAARAAALETKYVAAVDARGELDRCMRAVETVEHRLAWLRRPPLGDAELDALRVRIDQLRQDRDRLYEAIDALEYVTANREALAWTDAEHKLEVEQALVPALKDALQLAEQARDAAEQAESVARDDAEDATSKWQTADGRRRAALEQFNAAEARFRETGISEPSANSLESARADVKRLDDELAGIGKRIAELATEKGRRETAAVQAQRELADAQDKVDAERREAEPAVERWDRLRASATEHELSTKLPANLAAIRGHVNLVQEAQNHRIMLLERLRVAQSGQDLVGELEAASTAHDQTFGETYLQIWLHVRDWLRRRLPAQVADVDDPLVALLRLRDQLAALEDRLARQEGDLRGASSDVARGIEVQIRKARGQVGRLNKNLENVSFGSIASIRVRLQSVERMEQVLRALRDGTAQALLFSDDMPIEEALDEIFRRYGGGRTGGQRLLDYREYVHLQVEIRRRSGTDWEIANPTRLSTGEAIGVGAALMMVVLTEWERDANLLRGKKSTGSLRFLFLDEANRLSQDNLSVLFDLCQTLDLQLLIAAPEVARAEGNTTYRLVRRATADGREEVLVSGRRTRGAP